MAERFRKKPIEVEAMLFDGLNGWAVARWMRSGFLARGMWPEEEHPDGVVVHTLEGDMAAHVGDWIVKGVEGEFYPVKGSIFHATYEPTPTEDAPDG